MAGTDVTEFLVRCMEFDSSTGKEGKYATFLAETLREDGWNVLEQTVEGDRRNLLATRGSPRDVKVLMNTHLDQVPPYIPPTRDEKNVYGRACNETKGTSAIHKLLEVLDDIRGHGWPKSEVHGDTTFNIGLIQGGHALNAWAEKAQASIFFRVTTSVKDIKERLEKIVASRAELDYSLGGNDPVTFIKFQAKRIACSFNTDAPYYKKMDKLKGAFMYGAGSITTAFSAGEFVAIADLKEAVEMHYRLLESLLKA
ncbi:unnamed protein product, partial [Mesorhabditis spiculigera]